MAFCCSEVAVAFCCSEAAVVNCCSEEAVTFCCTRAAVTFCCSEASVAFCCSQAAVTFCCSEAAMTFCCSKAAVTFCCLEAAVALRKLQLQGSCFCNGSHGSEHPATRGHRNLDLFATRGNMRSLEQAAATLTAFSTLVPSAASAPRRDAMAKDSDAIVAFCASTSANHAVQWVQTST